MALWEGRNSPGLQVTLGAPRRFGVAFSQSENKEDMSMI